jgi:hypothetical protein
LERLEERCVLASTATPVVSVLPVAPREGLAFNGVVAKVLNPGINEPASSYSALISWGDGSALTTATLSGPTGGPFTVSASHTYAEEGPFSITVAVTNTPLGVTGGGSTPILVTDRAPAVTVVPITPHAGTPFSGAVATFTDPGGAEVATKYSGSINWGDGSTTGSSSITYNSATNVFTVYGSHLYATPAGKTLTVGVTDDGGVTGAGTWSKGTTSTAADVAVATGSNGLIYVFGSTVQAYNPANGTFTTEASPPSSVSYGTAAAGADGLIYVFGAGNATTTLAYSPATNTWTTRASLPIADASGPSAAAGPDGLIYVFGGHVTGIFDAPTSGFAEAYNPATNAWSAKASMPTAADNSAAVASPNGLIYVIGGAGKSSDLNTVQAYNPATNTWTTEASLSTTRWKPTAAVGVDGLIYVFGGHDSTGFNLLTAQAYDPTTNSFTTIANMPLLIGPGAAGGAAAGPDGLIYAFGGSQVQTYQTTGQTGSKAASITVAGPLTVTAPGAQHVPQGSAATVTLGSFNDPVASDSPWLVSVNWGDGSSNSSFSVNSLGAIPSLAHTYASAGLDTVRVTVTDRDGASGSASFSVTVASVAPVVSAVPITPPAGLTFNGIVANVTDLGNNEPANNYTALVNWGDGSASTTASLSGPTGGPFTVNASHTYATEGHFTLTVAVTNNAVGKTGSGQAAVVSVPPGNLPAQIRHAYGFDAIRFADGSPGDGTGQTIAIVVAYNQPNIIADLHAFDQQFGLPDPPSFEIRQPQGSDSAPLGFWGLEASLDVEWAHALAPGANILLVEARSAGTDLYAAVDYARQQPNVSVISMSWGSPEFSNETTFDQFFTTPTKHTGETFLAATGDQGAPGDYPAYSPNVLAVGGTALAAPLDAKGDYPDETGWGSGGGGVSQYEDQPDYQAGVVTQSRSKRATPDVSFDAGDKVAVYDSYDGGSGSPWTTAGGTSLATPSWAALVATADQGTSLLHQGTLTNTAVATALYRIAGTSGAVGFNDITKGNNGNPAGPGYDLVTGLGSPKAAALVAGLSGNIAAPTPSAPSGALADFAVPAFQWSAVAGAASYHLVVTDTGSNATVLDVTVTGATSYSAATAPLQSGHFYQWQIQANLPLAGQGPLSAPLAFSLPALNAPGSTSPSGEIATTTPTFSWSAVTAAAYYSITIFDEANPNVVFQSASNLTGTTYVLPTPLTSEHTYQWDIQAYVVFNGVPYASAGTNLTTFSVNAPGSPTLISPAADAVLTTDTPTFSWSPPAGGGTYSLTLLDLTSNTLLLNQFPIAYDASGHQLTSFTLSTPLASGHRYQWSLESVTSVTGAVPSAEFSVAVPGAGTLSTPVPSGPSGLVTTGQPTFSWSAVPGATGYVLYLFYAFNNSFPSLPGSTQPEPINVVGQTSYTPTVATELLVGKVYTWYVMAYDAAGDVSAPSTLLDFATSVPLSLSGRFPSTAPTLTAPLGTQTTYNPTFKWTAVSQANYYELTVIDETLHSYVFLSQPAGNSYTLGNDFSEQLVNSHSYRWYLKAVGDLFDFSAFATGTFTLAAPANTSPTLTSPGNGATVNTSTPTFKWTAVPGAVSYQWVLIDPTNTGFLPANTISPVTTGPLSVRVTVPFTSYTLPLPLTNGHTYQWEVNAFVSSGSGTVPEPESSLNTFTISAPTTPTLVSPSGTDTVTTMPTFQWSDDSSATEYALTLKDMSKNVTVLDDLRVAQTSYTPGAPLTNGDTYQWYVRAFDSVFDESPAPAPLTFTLAVPLAAPNLLGLTGTVNTTSPTFSWSAVPGATGYYLTVQDTTANTRILDALPVTGSTSYTFAGSLVSGHQYQWSVKAFDRNGVIGPVSDANVFSVFIPPAVLAPPAPNLAGSSTTFFQWSRVPGATGYSLNLVDVSAGTLRYTITPVQIGDVTSYGVNMPLIAGHMYEWEVLSYDNLDHESDWSTPVTFIAVPLAAPAFTSPATTTLVVGTPGSFTVTVSGTPAPVLNYSGALPNGVSFNSSTGLLSGTPGPGTAGDYALTFTAANGFGSNAIQNFTLHISPSVSAPAITSPQTAIFTVGTTGQFTIVVAGAPSPVLSFNGNLPAGVTFNPTTRVLGGKPALGSAGIYRLTLTASNGVAPDATQLFSLVVQGLPFDFDKLGAYRPGDGSWSLDSDGGRTFGPTSQVFFHFSPPGVTGVAGDWNGTGRSAIGDFKDGVWHLDLKGTGQAPDAGETFQFGQAGDQPVVGDWTGDGISKLGVFRTAPDGVTGEFILDVANHRAMDASNLVFTFGYGTDHIVVGDWTGDGKAKVGVYRDAKDFIPADAGDLVFSINGSGDHATFTNFVFGLATDRVVIGDWTGDGKAKVGVYRDGSTAPVGDRLYSPGVALFSLDSGALMFNAQSQVFLYGYTNDQFVAGNWPSTPPLLPAQFAAGGNGPGGAPALTEAALAPVLSQAIADWAARGADAALVAAVPVRIGALGGGLLGWTDASGVTLSPDAAGWGWFVDPTPGTSEEFPQPGADGWHAAPGGPAAGKMDLLTVVEHELGHELGLPDLDPSSHPADLMAATLATGARRTVS